MTKKQKAALKKGRQHPKAKSLKGRLKGKGK